MTVQVRKVNSGVVLQSLNISENELYYTPYLVSVSTGHCPAMIVSKQHPYYQKLEGEFNYLWSLNERVAPPIAQVIPHPGRA